MNDTEVRSAADPVVRAEAIGMAHHSLLMGVLRQTIDVFLEADAPAIEVRLTIRAGDLDHAGRPSPSEAPPARAAVSRDGRDWLVALGGRRVRVGHRIGMLHLAVLVANAGQEVDALELAAGPRGLAGVAEPREPTARLRSDQPVLDRVAIREYRKRLGQLRQELDDREAGRDTAGAARARAEREWLMAELASATGLGGRIRTFPNDQERARISVGKAVRRALAHIADVDPIIGDHLARTVHTGARCSYQPA